MFKIINDSQLGEKNYSIVNFNEFLSNFFQILFEKINPNPDIQEKLKEKFVEVRFFKDFSIKQYRNL